MRAYKVFDFVLGSDIELPELIEEPEAPPAWTFRLSPAHIRDSVDPGTFRHLNCVDGRRWLSVAFAPSGARLRFWDQADFVVSTGRRHITTIPLPYTSDNTIRHLLLDQVLPIVLTMTGHLILHAGAVASTEGAVGFMGVSGRGKSTLTASFAAEGLRLLTDDALLVSPGPWGFRVIPSYPGLRLWEDMVVPLWGTTADLRGVAAYSDKKRMARPQAFPSDPAPLLAIYLLDAPANDPVDEITVDPLSPREALVEIVRHAPCLDATDPKWLRTQFEQAGQLASQIPVLRLNYPRNISRLPEVRAQILRHARLPHELTGAAGTAHRP